MRNLTFFVSLILFVTTAKGQVEESLYYQYEAVRITDPNGLYATVEWKPEMKTELISMLGEETAEAIILGSHESAWPKGISSLFTRGSKHTEMLNYNCQYLTTVNKNMAVLLVAADENSHMDEDMKPAANIYFVIFDNAFKENDSENTKREQVFSNNLEIIVLDFEEGFGNLIGMELEYLADDDEIIFDCNVPLEGSYYLTFHEVGAESNISFRALFPGDINKESAQAMFQDLVNKVSFTDLSCCTLVKKAETAIGSSRSQEFEVAAKNGRLNPAFQKMVVHVTLEAFEAFTTEGLIVTEWQPVLYIYKK